MKSLPVDWTKDLKSPEDRDSRTKTIYNNSNNEVLMLLKRMVNNRHQHLIDGLISKEHYNTVQWANLMAHTNGERQTLKWLEDLLAFVNDR